MIGIGRKVRMIGENGQSEFIGGENVRGIEERRQEEKGKEREERIIYKEEEK